MRNRLRVLKNNACAQCGHCQRLAPLWEKVASELDGVVRVGKIDADEEEGAEGATSAVRCSESKILVRAEIRKSFDVTAFPTLKLCVSRIAPRPWWLSSCMILSTGTP